MRFRDYFKLLCEKAAKRSYACLMGDCPFLSDDIKKIQDQIEPDDIYDEEEGRGLEDEFHITVLYGLHENDADEIKSKLDLAPMSFELDGLSLFENEKFDVLKCGVKSADFKKANKQVSDEFEFTSDYPDYKPHLTVAYLQPGSGKKYLDIESSAFDKEHVCDKMMFSTKDSEKTHWTLKEKE